MWPPNLVDNIPKKFPEVFYPKAADQLIMSSCWLEKTKLLLIVWLCLIAHV